MGDYTKLHGKIWIKDKKSFLERCIKKADKEYKYIIGLDIIDLKELLRLRFEKDENDINIYLRAKYEELIT